MQNIGRPRDDYPEAEFRKLIMNRRQVLHLSVGALAKLAGMNKGTLSSVLSGARPCERSDRAALLESTHVDPAEQAKYGVGPRQSGIQELKVVDSQPSPLHQLLDEGQAHLFRIRYDAATQCFVKVYEQATSQANYKEEADSLMRLGWVHFERGSERSLRCIDASISAIEKHFGSPLKTILDSARKGSSSSICSTGDRASSILGAALHLRSKLLAEQVAHCGKVFKTEEAEQAFNDSLLINSFLGDPLLLAHEYRWQAVFLGSSQARSKVANAESLLSQARELFGQDSIGLAYLTRDLGLVNWYAGRPKHGRTILLNAISRLAAHSDSRAMGPVFYALSRLERDEKGDTPLARRYALAGATLHPYYFVRDQAVDFYEEVRPRDLERDIEQLYCGNGVFHEISGVLSTLVAEEGTGGVQAINRNLHRVFPRRVALLS